MSVLVDTTIWSLALRRRTQDLNRRESRLVQEWESLVDAGRVLLIGPIRQEILSGIRRESDFLAVRGRLSAFGCIEVLPEDYDQAAVFFNTCRGKGFSGTSVDLLICAVASRADVPIFTTDEDFVRYADILPIWLHEMPASS
jgi:predicted nucleic acid-binding protein